MTTFLSPPPQVVVGGNQLQVTTGFRSTSLNDLFFPPSRDVCVYVSYCDSQVITNATGVYIMMCGRGW